MIVTPTFRREYVNMLIRESIFPTPLVEFSDAIISVIIGGRGTILNLSFRPSVDPNPTKNETLETTKGNYRTAHITCFPPKSA